MKCLPRISVWMLLSALILTQCTPAFAAFNLDYVVVGRIWVPSLAVDLGGLPPVDRMVVVSEFGDCLEQGATREQLLQPRERDCRFERQIADALVQSGMFHPASPVPQQGADLVVSPSRSRVQFRRQVIPGVKPFLVLTLFTYLWTPLPFEVDVESYDLRVAVRDARGALLSEVAVAREFSHRLSSYSAEQTAPGDLVASMAASDRELAPIVVCRGPHAGAVVRELFQKLWAAVTSMNARSHADHAGFRNTVP